MITLTRDEILLMHKKLIERYGGSHGVRDENLLDSALNTPYQSFGEFDFYPTIVEKAVRLCYGLVKNHPFHDGNKRIGAASLLIMLKINDLSIHTDSAELSNIILSLADGTIDYEFLLQWVQDRII